jgi:nitroimidazol reductase NimA-like FMN-containing flavoprotein (pyridoxamine 5'-phosphate oxidase superfamily)
MDEEASQSTTEVLDAQECLGLLATMSVGRVAVAVPGQAPLVVPVNFALDGDVIVFRTSAGTKLEALLNHPASFQVDMIDPFHHTGWSVLVQGFAYECSSADLPVEPWASGPKLHWIRLFAGSITGRRLTMTSIELDQRGYR